MLNILVFLLVLVHYVTVNISYWRAVLKLLVSLLLN
jgi:hypothetical protein